MSDSDPAASATRSTRRSVLAVSFVATRERTRSRSTTFTAGERNGGFARLVETADTISHYYPMDDLSHISSYYAGLATSSRRAVGRRK